MKLSNLARDIAYPMVTFVLVVALWEWMARRGLFPAYVLPSPTAIFTRMVNTYDLLIEHAIMTSLEILAGFTVAAVVGVLLAGAIVFVKPIERAIYPWLVVVQVIPKVALGPLFVVWLGFGFLPKVIIAFLLAFFPIVIDTMIGLRSVSRDSLFLMRSMGAGFGKVFTHLQLPNALPNIFGSLKIAITLATVGAIVGEFIGANKGLGYVLISANGVLDTVLLFVALFWISAIALVFYGLVALLEHAFVWWHVSMRGHFDAATE
jgi:NitT/TauT family transport system permease protein